MGWVQMEEGRVMPGEPAFTAPFMVLGQDVFGCSLRNSSGLFTVTSIRTVSPQVAHWNVLRIAYYFCTVLSAVL